MNFDILVRAFSFATTVALALTSRDGTWTPAAPRSDDGRFEAPAGPGSMHRSGPTGRLERLRTPSPLLRFRDGLASEACLFQASSGEIINEPRSINDPRGYGSGWRA